MSACPLATAYPADPTRPSVPPNVLNEVKLASAETGVSQKLPLAILWQEQQWYQNSNPSLSGPLTEFGRFFDWSLTLGAKPDKSLGHHAHEAGDGPVGRRPAPRGVPARRWQIPQ